MPCYNFCNYKNQNNKITFDKKAFIISMYTADIAASALQFLQLKKQIHVSVISLIQLLPLCYYIYEQKNKNTYLQQI